MESILRNFIMLTLTLSISTGAAVFLKGLLQIGQWALHVNASPHRPRVAYAPTSAVPRRDSPAVILYKPQPGRTAEAISHGTTGTVKLSMRLNWDGTITDIKPLETLPDGLTERAMVAARGISFRPAIVGGQFTSAEQIVDFEFDARPVDAFPMMTQPAERRRK